MRNVVIYVYSTHAERQVDGNDVVNFQMGLYGCTRSTSPQFKACARDITVCVCVYACLFACGKFAISIRVVRVSLSQTFVAATIHKMWKIHLLPNELLTEDFGIGSTQIKCKIHSSSLCVHVKFFFIWHRIAMPNAQMADMHRMQYANLMSNRKFPLQFHSCNCFSLLMARLRDMIENVQENGNVSRSEFVSDNIYKMIINPKWILNNAEPTICRV